MKLFFCSLIIITNLVYNINSKTIQLYNPQKDDIVLVDSSTFEEKLYNRSYAIIIEFFAHWCGMYIYRL